MSELIKLNTLKKLSETASNTKCIEEVEFEKICVQAQAVFQQDTSDSTWFLPPEDVKDVVIKAVISLVQRARLPEDLSNENEEDCFKDSATVTAFVATTATAIFSSLHQGKHLLDDGDERKDGAQRLVRDVVLAVAPHCVVLIGTHSENHAWTSDKSRQASEGLGAVLCMMSSCDSVSQLLTEGPPWYRGSQDGGIFGDVMGLLKERLTRDSWHKEPATRQAFKWCLLQMKHPYLGQHLDNVLPPSLLFTDDYKVSNKLLGIQCLQHIIDNVDPSELRWYGRAMVIYEALYQQLYTQKPTLIGQLLPCLRSILAVIEKSPHKPDEPRKPNRYDTVLQTLLTSMEFEQKLALRQAYAKNLHLFIDSMGITVLRHMKRGLRVILKYLEASEGQDDISRMYALQSLNSLIVQTWPRIPSHWEIIMKALLKLLCSVCDSSNQVDKDVRSSITDGCMECLVLLKRCCRKNTEEALSEILSINRSENEAMMKCVERVLAG